mmetsp:Transcript_37276/g.63446  ORF Transcript_37276/g.63446 Transcript_37276/m.63446 type:complete len:146 (+) Transcript_37276:156-593(+)
MIQRYPAILSYSIPNKIIPKLDWLQQRLSLTDDELSNLMRRFPPLFSYSVDVNIEPTMNFFIDALGDEDEALALLIRVPNLFSYSLEKRLKPRLKEAMDVGMVIDTACLSRIGTYTESQWQKGREFQVKELAKQRDAKSDASAAN